MSSLQAVRALQHKQLLSTPKRRALAVAVVVFLGGGGLAYSQLGVGRRRSRPQLEPVENGVGHEVEMHQWKKSTAPPRSKGRARRGGLKSVKILALFLLARMGKPGLRNFLGLAAVAVLRTALSNRLARVQGLLFRAVFLRRVPLFGRLVTENLLLCLIQSLFMSTTKFLTGTLSLKFRKILTDSIHADYFESMTYYKLNHVDRRIVSPEQRIAGDVPGFCKELSELTQDNMFAVFDGILYTWRLCAYAHPKYVFGILGYVLGAGAITGILSPPFGKFTSKEQELEGDYRQLHSRLKTHSESVAFYGGQDREASIIKQRFKLLMKHVGGVVHTQWWFGMIQDFLLKYLGATFAVVLIIGPFFSGNLKPDTTTLGRAQMLSNLRYHTSVVISLFQSMGTLASSTRKLSRLSGYADRIHELMLVSKELRNSGSRAALTSGPGGNFIEAKHIEFDDVKVVTPTGNTLVDNLTLRVEQGSNLLITGPNGSGKSSLFRVLGGLWPLVAGRITKPGSLSDMAHEIFYVPQRPYTAVGTLRDQLIYPLTAAEETNPLSIYGMRELLKNVDLGYLLDRYDHDEDVDWSDELSLGEQQRLGMARLFYHKPAYAILDECTSAVTTDMEERFCAKVRAMGTSCVTISHRPALVAFHDTVLSLDGEGGWSVHYKSGKDGPSSMRRVESSSDIQIRRKRHDDANVVQQQFSTGKEDPSQTDLALVSYTGSVLASSPPHQGPLSIPPVPRLRSRPRSTPARISALMKILIPTLQGKQGGQLLAVALLVVLRTYISDRIASLNGTSVQFVLEQDKAAFIRLTGISVLQSAASSFVAPTLRRMTAVLSLGWRYRLTDHLSKAYFRNNAFYKAVHLSEAGVNDADQRITQDVEKLTKELAGLVTGMVKPIVDILWFTWRMRALTGVRGVSLLYAYMLSGLGFLRAVTPNFGALTSKEQELEGSFRYMHSRLRTHAESIAFFGGGAREKAVVDRRFRELIEHSRLLLKKQWLFGIADEFITKQLPHNVTWGLSFLYTLEQDGNRALTSVQGKLAHDLRFLASVVSQSFLAFGDILELYRKFLELSGGISRVSELDELLTAAEHDERLTSQKSVKADPHALVERRRRNNAYRRDIAFVDVDIVTPSQKLLARKLKFRVTSGQSVLVTGPNGSGKTSLFRVLGGLWPHATGNIIMPHGSNDGSFESGLNRDIFYVPQRPYSAVGTLRDQIIYPLSLAEATTKVVKEIERQHLDEEVIEDEEYNKALRDTSSKAALDMLDSKLRSIFEDVRLMYLFEREGGWDTVAKWEDMLSLGEQQRLGMARLFFHHPKFGILDECTNATSVDVEESLYKRAQTLGITVVTISQRPALIPYHSNELRLINGEGDWELRSINSS